MADAKITALTENTTPATTDLLAIVDDPAGTPATQKITLLNALKVINSLGANTTPVTTDVIAVIDDPGGTPVAQKMTLISALKVVGDLTENSTPALTDIILLIDDPGGTPLAQKITLTNLFSIIPAASDTASGIIEIAIQSEMETGTDTVRAVTPGRQHFHPSACKAFVASTQSSTTIQRGYNVASVADTGTGISTVEIATDMSDANYTVIVGAEHNSASGTTQTYNIDNGGRAVGTYVIQSWQVDGTEALTDPSASWFSAVFGDI